MPFPEWHPPFSSFSSFAGVWGAKPLFSVGRMQIRHFRRFRQNGPSLAWDKDTVYQKHGLCHPDKTLALWSGVAPAKQTKERAKTKSSWEFRPFFCVNSGVFPLENKHDSHIELLFRNAPAKSSWTDLSLVRFVPGPPDLKTCVSTHACPISKRAIFTPQDLVIAHTTLLELRPFRLVPIFYPARRAKTENDWQRKFIPDRAYAETKISKVFEKEFLESCLLELLWLLWRE